MAGVLGAPSLTRQDAIMGVGRTQRFAVRWRRSTNLDGSDPQVFDMAGYAGRLTIMSTHGELWLSKRVSFDDEQGLVAAEILPTDTENQDWKSRTVGEWAITVTAPSGEVTVLVSGVMRLVQNGAV